MHQPLFSPLYYACQKELRHTVWLVESEVWCGGDSGIIISIVRFLRRSSRRLFVKSQARWRDGGITMKKLGKTQGMRAEGREGGKDG